MTEVLQRHRLLLKAVSIAVLLKALGYTKEFNVGLTLTLTLPHSKIGLAVSSIGINNTSQKVR